MSAWTPARREKLRRLWEQSAQTGEEIAVALDSSRGSVMRELKSMGLRINGGKKGPRPKKARP